MELPLFDIYQQEGFNLFLEGESLCIVGAGGSGKSFLLRKMLYHARTHIGSFPKVMCLGYSNNVAKSLDGLTIHKAFGAPPSWDFTKIGLLDYVSLSKRRCDSLRLTKVLVIDEISAVRDDTLDAIDYVMRMLPYGSFDGSIPFGGRQVVMCGDPFQLEPMKVSDDQNVYRSFFQSRSWRLLYGPIGTGKIVILSKNHRQSSDASFHSILSRIRIGAQNEPDITAINSTSFGREYPENSTKLCLYKDEVKLITRHNQKKLPGPIKAFHCVDRFCSEEVHKCYDFRKQCLRRLQETADSLLQFKVGDLVIFSRMYKNQFPGTSAQITSIQASQVTVRLAKNEKQQVVVGFVTYHIHDCKGTVLATRMQLPLISGYAITVHRAQGLTLDNVAIDFTSRGCWKPNGNVYVALSRATSMAGLWVKGLKSDMITVSSRVRCLNVILSQVYNLSPSRIVGCRKYWPLNIFHSNNDLTKKKLQSKRRGTNYNLDSLSVSSSIYKKTRLKH